jgi:hypothetical protein
MARWPALVVGILMLGCGPSLRQSQQSRVYFERCYAADFDPRIVVAEKRACWTAWLEHYTIAQPEERREYARARVHAIEQGESVPRLPGLPQAAMGPRAFTPVMAVSAPPEEEEAAAISADAVPADEVDLPRRRRRARAAPLPRTGNAICAAIACEPAWRRCVDTCPAGAAACETACNVELNACARGCF